jgi:two-component system sensor histidine kinase TctE
VIALVVVVVVQRATRPVRRLSASCRRARGRPDAAAGPDAPRELLPLVDATNEVMSAAGPPAGQPEALRARHLAPAAHAAGGAEDAGAVGAARRRRAAAGAAEINDTVDRATVLANQMLSLAKVEQLRQQADAAVTTGRRGGARVALDLAPLIADKDLDFDIETQPAPVLAHEWMLRELTRNLLHNAIKHTRGRALSVRVVADARTAALVVSDSGPGIPPSCSARLFQPFSAGDVRSGSGLGLAICHEIVLALGGTHQLENREKHGPYRGPGRHGALPLAENGG